MIGRALLPAVLAPFAVAAATLLGGRAALPILATVAVYPIMASFVVRGRQDAAAGAVLLWAAALSASVIVLSARNPERAGTLIIHGPAYRDEMFAFIRTGRGREGDPARYLPQHAAHLAAFTALSALSGGLLGIALGAVLVAFMSYYVGALAAAGGAPWLAFVLGWPPYALIRVVAYVLLGVALSRPLLAVVGRLSIPFARRRAFYLAAAGLLLIDAALKGLLAPIWAGLLRPCLQP